MKLRTGLILVAIVVAIIVWVHGSQEPDTPVSTPVLASAWELSLLAQRNDESNLGLFKNRKLVVRGLYSEAYVDESESPVIVLQPFLSCLTGKEEMLEAKRTMKRGDTVYILGVDLQIGTRKQGREGRQWLSNCRIATPAEVAEAKKI